MANPIGSSPRVWGQVSEQKMSSYRLRIIPTRVGTSNGAKFSDGSTPDHPHACGDKKGIRLFCLVYLGSSPRVWGQVTASAETADGTGIIPTRVGTSFVPLTLPPHIRDHPHACGDKTFWHHLAVSL